MGSVITHVEEVTLMSMPSATVIVETIFVELPGYTEMVWPVPMGETPRMTAPASNASSAAMSVVATWLLLHLKVFLFRFNVEDKR